MLKRQPQPVPMQRGAPPFSSNSHSGPLSVQRTPMSPRLLARPFASDLQAMPERTELAEPKTGAMLCAEIEWRRARRGFAPDCPQKHDLLGSWRSWGWLEPRWRGIDVGRHSQQKDNERACGRNEERGQNVHRREIEAARNQTIANTNSVGDKEIYRVKMKTA